MSEPKVLCPIMSRPPDNDVISANNTVSCQEDECQWWTDGVTRDGHPGWDCAIVIGITGYAKGRRGT